MRESSFCLEFFLLTYLYRYQLRAETSFYPVKDRNTDLPVYELAANKAIRVLKDPGISRW